MSMKESKLEKLTDHMILVRYKCDCLIMAKPGNLREPIIVYCPRHAAADDMYERLGECCYGLEAVTSYHNNDAWDEEIRKAQATLAKAGSEPAGGQAGWAGEGTA